MGASRSAICSGYEYGQKAKSITKQVEMGEKDARVSKIIHATQLRAAHQVRDRVQTSTHTLPYILGPTPVPHPKILT